MFCGLWLHYVGFQKHIGLNSSFALPEQHMPAKFAVLQDPCDLLYFTAQNKIAKASKFPMSLSVWSETKQTNFSPPLVSKYLAHLRSSGLTTKAQTFSTSSGHQKQVLYLQTHIQCVTAKHTKAGGDLISPWNTPPAFSYPSTE